MRIVWKDSQSQIPRDSKKYRKHMIMPYNEGDLVGWVLDFEDDRNIYASRYSAMNAIDARLGGYGRRGKPPKKREKCGIQIIGTYSTLEEAKAAREVAAEEIYGDFIEQYKKENPEYWEKITKNKGTTK